MDLKLKKKCGAAKRCGWCSSCLLSERRCGADSDIHVTILLSPGRQQTAPDYFFVVPADSSVFYPSDSFSIAPVLWQSLFWLEATDQLTLRVESRLPVSHEAISLFQPPTVNYIPV